MTRQTTVRSLAREAEVRGWLGGPTGTLSFFAADLNADAGRADAVADWIDVTAPDVAAIPIAFECVTVFVARLNRGGNIMIRYLTIAVALAATATVASAKQYDDYVPEKGLWEINAVEVDPNHIDDYLTGLRKSDVPVFEVMKAHGMIDAYKFVVRNGYSKGSPNILIETHFVSAAMLVPDKARDQMIEKEILAKFSEADGKVAVAGYEKYRQFLDDGYWSEITFAK